MNSLSEALQQGLHPSILKHIANNQKFQTILHQVLPEDLSQLCKIGLYTGKTLTLIVHDAAWLPEIKKYQSMIENMIRQKQPSFLRLKFRIDPNGQGNLN
jgi:hypothetical protein